MRFRVEIRDPRKAAFPAWAGPAERLRYLLRYAVLAPSRHNSQPWMFEIEGDELRVFGDWRRALKVADPHGRELVMACGAAVYNVEVAAQHYGHVTSVEVVPGGRKDGLLARLTLEERHAPSEQDEALFEAIPKRRTNRFAFDAREVPFGVVSGLVRETAAMGASLRVVERSARPAVAGLVAEGDRIQWSSARFRSELASWSRANKGRVLDGVPGYAHGLSDSASVLHRMLLRLTSGLSSEQRRDRHYALNTRALLALCTSGDTVVDWFTAGRAMQRILLLGTSQDLSASYFSQAVEVAPVRAKLREALGERGQPQLLFRLGFGGVVRPVPRRPVELILRSMSTASRQKAIVHQLEVERPEPASGAAPTPTTGRFAVATKT
jgi:hypothetical protein